MNMRIEQFFRIGMDREINPPKDLIVTPGETVLNLGAGRKIIPGTIALDFPEWDADTDPIPYGDGSCAGVWALHFLEHLERPVAMLHEIQRVLRPGGILNIVVPYYRSQMQAHDLDHKAQFCEETWRVLFGTPYYNKNKIEWKLDITFNIIIGIVERNLALMTQMVKRA